MRLPLGHRCRKAKVYQLHLPSLSYHHILRLDIAMGDAIRMQVGHRLSELQSDLIAEGGGDCVGLAPEEVL